MRKELDFNKVYGCLLGGAIGDALGYPVEFLKHKQIVKKYGFPGITEFNGNVVSDDTQMTLFTASGMIQGLIRGERGAPANMQSSCYKANQNWLFTQAYTVDDFKAEQEELEKYYRNDLWLMTIPELYERRAPGRTCITAISSGKIGEIGYPINDSKGCGGVMRVAPVAIAMSQIDGSPAGCFCSGMEAAATTHGNPLGYLPAGILCYIIARIIDGETDISKIAYEALDDMEEVFQWEEYKKYRDDTAMRTMREIIEKAIDIADSDMDDVDAIHSIGGGWVAEETLAIALYCAIKYSDDFESAIVAAVNHNGDSDSTGAVCGNILGALIGADAIPEKYKSVEFADVIKQMAYDLAFRPEYEDWTGHAVTTEVPTEGYEDLDTTIEHWITKY